MGRAENRLLKERIAEAVEAAEHKFFHQGRKVADITDITKFGVFLVAEAKQYGKVMVEARFWRSNYPDILEGETIALARKRMEHYREGIIERDNSNDS